MTTTITTTTPAPIQLGNRNGGTLLLQANKEWRTRPADQRFETLEALSEKVTARRRASRSINVELQALHAKPSSDGDGLIINSGIAPVAPSHHAFGQLSRLVGAPASYLRKLPTELAARCLNQSLEDASAITEKMKLLTYSGESEGDDKLAAVTSTTYGRVWDSQLVEAAMAIRERTGGRFFNPKDWSGKPSGLYASDRDVFIFMVDGGSIVEPGDARDVMHRGFIMWNSETGDRTFGLMTFHFRVVCGNHMIWDATNVSQMIMKHSSGAPDRFASEATPRLLNYANASVAPVIDQVTRARNIRLRDLVNLPGQSVTATDKIGDEWAREFAGRPGVRGLKFTVSEVRDALKFARAEEGQAASLWDLFNGFTASARGIEYTNDRVDLELRAGKLMELVKN